jgi:hypothetical protein
MRDGNEESLMKSALRVFFIFALATAAVGQSEQTTGNTLTLNGTLVGPRTAQFVSLTDSCDGNDVPDAMARAFRDASGAVHFVTASSQLFQSLGPGLDDLKHSCDSGYQSVGDPDPAHFDDQVWIDSFYTFDGKNVAGLGHTEYHGWSHPGECGTQNPNYYFECEYDADTYHLSTDGGYHFDHPAAPANFLAGVPYEYPVDRGPMGYSVDTNIIEWNGWYYALATSYAWPINCTGLGGPDGCLTPEGGSPLRTQDVFDPSSWRGWNGNSFSLTFVDPYLGPVENPSAHVYTPVTWMDVVNAINVYEPAHVVVATLWDAWDNEYGAPGLYISTSTDLVNWTTPTLVVTLAQMLASEPEGSWSYAYFSLLDPAAQDMNFSTIGHEPYLYYTRLNNNNTSDRVLFREKVKLTVNQ